jgi:hypothetical protein
MQTVHETRRQRLGMLKKQYGTWADLNQAIGWEKTSSRLSQIYSATIRSDRGKPFVMGDETAREIEDALSLTTGWMDTPPTYAELNGHPDVTSQAVLLLDAMEPEARWQALRVLGALTKPSNGTTGGQ